MATNEFKNIDEELAFCMQQVAIFSNRATQLLKSRTTRLPGEKEGVSTPSARKGKKKQYLSDEVRRKLYERAIS